MKLVQKAKLILNTLVVRNNTCACFSNSLVQGVFGFVLLVALSYGWLYFSAEKTAEKLQSLIPKKTAIIEVSETTQAGKDSPVIKLEGQRTIKALRPAPVEGFYEESNGKYLPIISPNDGALPFDVYKLPFSALPDVPYVSIAVVDYGLSNSASQDSLDALPAEVSFVLSPYSGDSSKWAASSRAFGHEFWLSLPMETEDFGDSDTGPFTILKNAIEQENIKRLTRVLETSVGYCGVVLQSGHDGSLRALKPVIEDIQKRGLGLAESTQDILSAGLTTQGKNIFVQNDLWLDDDLRPASIDGKFLAIEQKAKRDGHVVVFTRPYPVVINKIKEWSALLKDKNIQLAPFHIEQNAK